MLDYYDNDCNCNQGHNRLIQSENVNNLSTSIITSVPGPAGPEGDTFTPEESDNIFTI